MKKLSTILIVAALFLILSLVAMPAKAAVRCETEYGVGEVCREIKLEVDKEVWDPYDERFEENLFLDEKNYKFAPGEIIRFKIKVTNVGDETFDKVNVEDYLPNYLVLESGELSFEIYDLTPGETEKREFEAKVVSAEMFPDNTIICEDNRAKAWSGDDSDEDTARVCLIEKVLGVEELPPTGPENWLTVLVLTVASVLTGLTLLYKAKEGSWKI